MKILNAPERDEFPAVAHKLVPLHHKFEDGEEACEHLMSALRSLDNIIQNSEVEADDIDNIIMMLGQCLDTTSVIEVKKACNEATDKLCELKGRFCDG